MNSSVDGQNQRKKSSNKSHVNINKNKRAKRKNKMPRYNWTHNKKINFWGRNKKLSKTICCKDWMKKSSHYTLSI